MNDIKNATTADPMFYGISISTLRGALIVGYACSAISKYFKTIRAEKRRIKREAKLQLRSIKGQVWLEYACITTDCINATDEVLKTMRARDAGAPQSFEELFFAIRERLDIKRSERCDCGDPMCPSNGYSSVFVDPEEEPLEN